MCRAVTCSSCGKASWAGCGAHVESVLAHVPTEQRCRCREEDAAKGGPKEGQGWLSRIFRSLG